MMHIPYPERQQNPNKKLSWMGREPEKVGFWRNNYERLIWSLTNKIVGDNISNSNNGMDDGYGQQV